MFDLDLEAALEPRAVEKIEGLTASYFRIRNAGRRFIMEFKEDIFRWDRELGRAGGKFKMLVEFERYAEITADDPWLLLHRERFTSDFTEYMTVGEFGHIDLIEAEWFFASLARADKSTKIRPQVAASLARKAEIEALQAEIEAEKRRQEEAAVRLVELFVEALAKLNLTGIQQAG